MGCCGDTGPDGETLVALGMAAAVQLAHGRAIDELGTLAAFFSVLGDNLALIAARRAMQDAQRAACEEARKACCKEKEKEKEKEPVNSS